MRAASFSLLIVLLCTTQLHAQRLEDASSAFSLNASTGVSTSAATDAPKRSPRRIAAAETIPPPSGATMVFMGTALGAMGLFGGGAMGYAMESCSAGEWFCGMAGAIIGGTIGSTVMVPVGVHLGGRNSTYGRKLATAAVVALIGFGLAPATEGASLLAIPPAQLLATMAVEYKTARSRRSGQ